MFRNKFAFSINECAFPPSGGRDDFGTLGTEEARRCSCDGTGEEARCWHSCWTENLLCQHIAISLVWQQPEPPACRSSTCGCGRVPVLGWGSLRHFARSLPWPLSHCALSHSVWPRLAFLALPWIHPLCFCLSACLPLSPFSDLSEDITSSVKPSLTTLSKIAVTCPSHPSNQSLALFFSKHWLLPETHFLTCLVVFSPTIECKLLEI